MKMHFLWVAIGAALTVGLALPVYADFDLEGPCSPSGESCVRSHAFCSVSPPGRGICWECPPKPHYVCTDENSEICQSFLVHNCPEGMFTDICVQDPKDPTKWVCGPYDQPHDCEVTIHCAPSS
jgi:hypothetical protein